MRSVNRFGGARSLLSSFLLVCLAAVLAPAPAVAQVSGIERGGGFDRPYVPPRKRIVATTTRRPPTTRPPKTNGGATPVADVEEMVVPAAALQRYEAGRAAYDRNDFEKAITEFEAAIRLESKYLDAYIDLGDAQFDNANLEEAIESYRRALVIDKNNLDAQYRLGRAAFAGRDYDAALTAYQAVLKEKPTDPEAIYNLGLTYKLLKRYDEAIPYFQQAIKAREVPFPEARVNLARSYFEQNKLDEAEAEARKAIAELGPETQASSTAWYSVATALAKKPDLPGATDALQKAIDVCKGCPNDILSRYYLALAQINESRGLRDQAASAYERFLQLAPFVPDYQIEDIRARITRLRAKAT